MIRRSFIQILASLAVLATLCSCVTEIPDASPGRKRVGFNISVTREGEAIAKGRVGRTKGAVDESDNMISTMDKGIPFGLVGIDYEHNALVLDNKSIASDGGQYSMFLG